MNPHPPTPAQREAADPRRSFWVTANAGSGKTRVLSERALRLLLDGAAPEAILCLTFTRAAAAEMAQRIEARLASWAAMDEARLEAELEALEGAPQPAARVERARALFATVLDAPSGLPIMTIHAFANSLLRRFPIEANAPPGFEALIDRDVVEVLAEARGAVLRAALERPSTARSLAVLQGALQDVSITEALDEVVRRRSAIRRAAPPGGLEARLRECLGLGADENAETLIASAVIADERTRDALKAAAAALLGHGGKDAKGRGQAIEAWLARSAPPDRAAFDGYARHFLTEKGEIKKRLVDKATAKASAAAMETLTLEAERLMRLRERLRAAKVLERSLALLELGLLAADAYEDGCGRRSALDFDAQIELAGALLEPEANPSWVHYKLDRRIDHVLIDEAQDTSPGQWRIVERIAAPLFDTPPAERERPRTLFVVGDEKQSIYGFQGADLAAFRAVGERLSAQLARNGDRLERLSLEENFRSAPAVLELADACFASEEAKVGLVERGASVRHRPMRRAAAGQVELWPLEPAAETPEIEDVWDPRARALERDDAAARLAERIVDTIEALLASGETCPSTGLAWRPGDVLVLARKRQPMQELMVRLLKRRGVPVAGADRLPLNAHIAVRDFVALGRAALLPEDDLSLAAALKSPLFGLDDGDLLALTEHRGKTTLRAALARRASVDPRFAATEERLARWLARADFTPPFEFYSRILAEPLAIDAKTQRSGLAAFAERLGREAIEPLEAFLGQALDFERGRPATLEGFLHWLEGDESDLKRDPAAPRDEVRVLTVHGVKGLEAPAVFLADAGPRRASRARDRLIAPPSGEAGPPLWLAKRDEAPQAVCARIDAREQREAEEDKRLFYVALTRARDRLWIAGVAPKRRGAQSASGVTSWWDRAREALSTFEDAEKLEGGAEGPIVRRRTGGSAPPPSPAATAREREAPELPDWARTAAPAEAKPPPSVEGEAESFDPEAAAFGAAVHALLQRLPDLAPGERDAAARRLLAASGEIIGEARRNEAIAHAGRILSHPELAPVFSPPEGVRARAEASVAGMLGGLWVRGRIDRLAIGADRVWIVDFKTGAPPPASARPPASIQRQLARYAALIGAIHPNETLEAWVVWTRTGRIDRLASEDLAPHIQSFSRLPSASERPDASD